ncbi:hypothetical protein D030_2844A, partial [Vibrio parahaemolyticus AQ3810]
MAQTQQDHHGTSP